MKTPKMKIAGQWLQDILWLLYRRRTATRSQIAEATNLNPASVSQALRHLLANGTLERIGELRSTGGRKREVLKLNSEAGYFVVLDLEGTRIRCALTNFMGDIRYRWEESVLLNKQLDTKRLIDGIRSLLRQLSPSEYARVLAIGVSYTGTMDRLGRVTAVNLGWSNFPLQKELEKHLDLRIFLANGGLCKAQAELWHGVADNQSDFLYVVAGIGIGLGIFSNGSFVQGAGGMAGEFGHMTVDPCSTRTCACGKVGCLETIASSPNLVHDYLEQSGLAPNTLQAQHVAEVFARRGTMTLRQRSRKARRAGPRLRTGTCDFDIEPVDDCSWRRPCVGG